MQLSRYFYAVKYLYRRGASQHGMFDARGDADPALCRCRLLYAILSQCFLFEIHGRAGNELDSWICFSIQKVPPRPLLASATY